MPTTNNSSLEQQIKHDPDVPVIPPAIVTLLKALNDNDILYDQLAKELEKFPSIAIKIVAIANSAWALPEEPITNLPDACSRLGLNIVRSVSIALSISQIFDPSRCPAFNTVTYWTSALLNAESAFLCAKEHPDICPNTARLSGLLHNIGLLWLADKKPIETESAILNTQENQDHSLAESLYKILGIDYFTVGGQLAMAMELPEVITTAISAEEIACLNSETPSIKNHCYARQLTASVIHNMETESNMGTETESENILPSEYNEDPNYQKLVDCLPKIQAMAVSIFSN